MAFDNTFQNNMNTVYLHSSEDRDGRHHNKARRISSYSDATSRSVVQPEDAAEHFHFGNLAASAFDSDPFWSAPFDAKESASPASPVSSVSSGHSTDSDDSESTEFHQPQVPADISFELSFSVSSPEQSYDDISSLNFFSNPLSGFGLQAEPLFQNDVLAYPIRIADPDPSLPAPGAISAPLPLPSFQPQPQIAPLPMILPLPGAPSNVAMEATSDGSDSEFESETEVEVEEVVEGPAEFKLLPASCAASFGHKDGTNGNLLTIREDRPCLLAIYHPEAQRHCAARGTFEVIFRIPDDTRSVVVSGKKMQENGVKIQVPRLAPRLVRKCPRYPDSSDLYTVEIRFGNCQLFFPIKSRVKN